MRFAPGWADGMEEAIILPANSAGDADISVNLNIKRDTHLNCYSPKAFAFLCVLRDSARNVPLIRFNEVIAQIVAAAYQMHQQAVRAKLRFGRF